MATIEPQWNQTMEPLEKKKRSNEKKVMKIGTLIQKL